MERTGRTGATTDGEGVERTGTGATTDGEGVERTGTGAGAGGRARGEDGTGVHPPLEDEDGTGVHPPEDEDGNADVRLLRPALEDDDGDEVEPPPPQRVVNQAGGDWEFQSSAKPRIPKHAPSLGKPGPHTLASIEPRRMFHIIFSILPQLSREVVEHIPANSFFVSSSVDVGMPILDVARVLACGCGFRV